MAIKAVIRVSGDWCNGYWYEIVNSASGRTIHESGPYHSGVLANPKQVAYEDAEDWAFKNDIEVTRYA